ncbi:hypothetical protein JAAARDRAFT_137465 [Jaapia argillacea MUCL 33604]|uniref:Clathrin/coatomer adaptor adaptin-like N-terminal domain-containing protein n=1 Tax=Jaapia argillacea MUCL 33604 TaxID=933084 RepID=A0A067PEB5_9AGAM|nr:hypothetical protein JAAARDRAFT_137465 [Jaapia argillacea MUCL 33604]
MAGLNLNTITENASRLGMRLQETISEHTRDLAIGKTPGSTYLDTPEDKANIRKSLDSNSDREKLQAMKRLVALISKGRNVSEYFPLVVKSVASPSLEVRKLVYIFLLRYAESEPDLALLSINTFQKDLNDPNPLIRAMALRVLSGIKVGMIGGIVVMAVRKCAADNSPYVRKVAALAIPKCYQLDNNHLPELISIIQTLLRDRSPLSLGSTSVAFLTICPTRLDLLHQHYRRLCRTLVDVDEWGQVDLMNLLMRYARVMLPRPIVTMRADAGEEGEGEEEVDKDLELLLGCVEPLVQSRNPAVVMATIKLIYYLGPPSSLPKVVQPLFRLLTISKEVERCALVYMRIIARRAPHLFAPFYTKILVRADDSTPVKRDKVKLLLTFLNTDNYQALLREFIDYADDVDDQLVSESIQAIGHCARLVPDSTQQCLTALLNFIKSPHDVVVSNAVLVLKSLVQNQMRSTSISTSPKSTISIVSSLAYRIDDIRHPQARACVIWLVGQYAGVVGVGEEPKLKDVPGVGGGIEGIALWAPDVLRKTAKTFIQEDSIVKLQIITLTAKLLVLNPSDRTLTLLARYVFSLARYDLNYDIRDRARMLSSLLGGVLGGSLQGVEGEFEERDRGGVVLRREQVKLVLFEGKAEIVQKDSWLADDQAILGSLAAVTGREMRISDHYFPDWLEEGTESSLRDTEDDKPQVSVYAQATPARAFASSSNFASPVVLTPASGPSPVGSVTPATKGRYTDDLEKFYADEGTDEEEEEEEGESEEEEEEGEKSVEEEEGSEEEDEDEESEEESERQHLVRQTGYS